MILDPWLIGSEVDIAKWFNEQWHATEPIAPADLPSYQYIAVSQSYSDHCHEPTLDAMSDVPVWAVPKAKKRLSNKIRQGISEIPDLVGGSWAKLGELELALLHPGNRMDPVYYSLVIKEANSDAAIIYAPHGFALNSEQQKAVSGLKIELLITTIMEYKLPALLGGTVNPGLDAAFNLAQQLKPRWIINSHDEQKKAKGLVSKLAKIKWPDYEKAQSIFSGIHAKNESGFLRVEDYRVLEI